MKKSILILAFALPLFIFSSTYGQCSECVKTIMSNTWVKKYKKLKIDLEEKASYVKNMKNISESDMKAMEMSYIETGKMLDLWVLHFAKTIKDQKVANQYLAEGTINPELKEELFAIFTFYNNGFITRYEEITGQQTKTLIGNENLYSEKINENPVKLSEIDKSTLVANVINPLRSTAWKAIY